MSKNPGVVSGEVPDQFSAEDGPSTLHQVFSRVARRFPDAVAVTDGPRRLTYRQLDERSERLAGVLREAGVGRERRVGLCVERGLDLIVGILGILKAGGGYVPVDPAYPAQRREYILDSCDAGVVVTHRATAGLAGARQVVDVGALPAGGSPVAAHEAADGSSLAYTIFTSGSTGQPKGVLIEHRSALRLFTRTHGVFAFDEHDVWCNFHSASFDFSVWEVWGALLFGGRLVMVPKPVARDPQALLRLLREERVTVLNQTPSAFRNLMNAALDADGPAALPDLRQVVFGGERLDARTLAPWVERHGLDRPALVNMYGITETTVHATWKRISASDLTARGHSPIGVPISDLTLDIVDEDGHSLPIGAQGRIQVSGPGLARGYLNHPEATRERFPERADAEGNRVRWYDSGDLGVQIGPGEFAYVGRADRQLKVRGHRIEPAEIEACVKGHADVRDCVVAADAGEGSARLVAFIVARQGGATLVQELRARVAAELPHFMAPSLYLPIDAIPVTVNGKLDQDALQKLIDGKRADTGAAGDAGASVADGLRAIWAAVLQSDEIGETDEFFDLGGTSFSLIHMLNQVNERFQLRLNAGVFSEGATIAALTAAVLSRLSPTPDEEMRHV